MSRPSEHPAQSGTVYKPYSRCIFHRWHFEAWLQRGWPYVSVMRKLPWRMLERGLRYTIWQRVAPKSFDRSFDRTWAQLFPEDKL